MRYLIVVLPLLVGCAIPADPCPLPASEHPEAWTEKVTLDSFGNVLFITYICTGLKHN